MFRVRYLQFGSICRGARYRDILDPKGPGQFDAKIPTQPLIFIFIHRARHTKISESSSYIYSKLMMIDPRIPWDHWNRSQLFYGVRY